MTPEKILSNIDSRGRYKGSLYLEKYEHPLPARLESVEGDLSLQRYDFPLPARLASVGGTVKLGGHIYAYKYPFPAGFKSVGGDLDLFDHDHPLPAGFARVQGNLNLSHYRHPLPAGFESVKGDLGLSFYRHPLPAGFESVGGDLDLKEYEYPLPGKLAEKASEDGWVFRPYKGSLDRGRWSLSPFENVRVKAPTSRQFRDWFGRSRVRSETGAPLLVYHGTQRGGFAVFDLQEIDRDHNGFYFTDDLDIANTYIGSKSKRIQDPTPSLDGSHPASAKGVYRVWLRMENPFEFDARGGQWNRLDVPEYPGLETTFEVARAAKADGYDGVIFYNLRDRGIKADYDEPANTYVAFSPYQIKSALFNRGTFDPNDPDIRKNPSRRTSRRRKTSRKAR